MRGTNDLIREYSGISSRWNGRRILSNLELYLRAVSTFDTPVRAVTRSSNSSIHKPSVDWGFCSQRNPNTGATHGNITKVDGRTNHFKGINVCRNEVNWA